MAATLDDYRWLVSGDAAKWLDAVRALKTSGGSTAGLVVKLRKDLSLVRAHLVIEQIELRDRARDKFAHPQRLYFTKQGLEQATDERLAEYKAERFAAGASLVDVCCGIGGDLMAMASRGPASGIDNDPLVAVLAAANLAAIGVNSQSRVDVAEASSVSVGACSAWHCDPDRRSTGRRTTTLQQFSPSLSQLESLLIHAPHAAIKLAPASTVPDPWSVSAEREWLGSRRECRQQVAWFGALANHPGKRTATVVAQHARRTVVEMEAARLTIAQECRRYIFEPHSAVLAAHLTSALAHEHNLAQLDAAVAYLTGDTFIDDLALDAFELLDLLPFDRKQLRAYCRQHRLGRLEIKKRGVALDPEQLRREVASQGDAAATIIIAPISGRVHALVTRRV